MATYNTLEQRILEKIRQLPPEKVIEVEEFYKNSKPSANHDYHPNTPN
jgi:hypothetical protein